MRIINLLVSLFRRPAPPAPRPAPRPRHSLHRHTVVRLFRGEDPPVHSEDSERARAVQRAVIQQAREAFRRAP